MHFALQTSSQSSEIKPRRVCKARNIQSSITLHTKHFDNTGLNTLSQKHSLFDLVCTPWLAGLIQAEQRDLKGSSSDTYVSIVLCKSASFVFATDLSFDLREWFICMESLLSVSPQEIWNEAGLTLPGPNKARELISCILMLFVKTTPTHIHIHTAQALTRSEKKKKKKQPGVVCCFIFFTNRCNHLQQNPPFRSYMFFKLEIIKCY